ncbi:MAG: Coenzyme F420 hydrogenase/dehydrogenase, beta subunit C-terminal domain, partial [Desulfobacteraceae bacterium]|nr:Coenzyme F420 hydrogenase/dehydrogenase, beta subunit C-terminal domain [Desulfobacteraceae bacterium]
SPSIKALKEMRKEGVEKIAFVGTPCQINTIRKMEAMGIVPADSIEFCFGLFCAGNFIFHDKEFHQIEDKYGFKYNDIESINIKEDFIINLESGERKTVPIDELDIVKRTACNLCRDFSAEYADISFGGIGAERGWTTIITRNPLGRAVLVQAFDKVLESYKYEDNSKYATNAEDAVLKASRKKKEKAEANLKDLEDTGVSVIG